MKLRIQGTLQELEAALDALRLTFVVNSVSKPYKDRNDETYRVYVDAEVREQG